MKKTILVVEDDESLRNLLKKKFVQEGYEVVEGENGIEGLKLFKDIGPDLLLMDVVMPKMDGITMLKEIRKLEGGKKIPVIVLTNLSDHDELSAALENGVYDYLIKSNWKLTDVVERVKLKLE